MKLKLSLATRANYTVMLAATIYLAVCMLMGTFDADGDILRGSALSALFVSVGAIFLPAFLFWQLQREPFAPLRFGLKRVPVSLMLLALPIGVALYMLSGGLSTFCEFLAKYLGLSAAPKVELDVSGWRIAGTLAVSALIPAIAEETLFHGVLLFAWADIQRPYNLKKRAVGAVLLSSLIFALFHCDLVNLLPIFITCTAMGAVAYISRSAEPSMVIHFTISVIGIIFYAVINGGGAANEYAVLGFQSEQAGALIYIAAGAALLAVSLICYNIGIKKSTVREKRAREVLKKLFDEMDAGDMAPMIKHFKDFIEHIEKVEAQTLKPPTGTEAAAQKIAEEPTDKLLRLAPLLFTFALLFSLNILMLTARLPK